MKSPRTLIAATALILGTLAVLVWRSGTERPAEDPDVVESPEFTPQVPSIAVDLPPTPMPPAATAEPEAIRATPQALSVSESLKKVLFDAGEARTVDQLLANYQELGITLSRPELVEYLHSVRGSNLDLASSSGGWNGLLSFWARRDGEASLQWALSQGLNEQDEIVFRMLESWGKTNTRQALHALTISELAAGERGQAMIRVLQNKLGQEEERLDRFAQLSELYPINSPSTIRYRPKRPTSSDYAATAIRMLYEQQNQLNPEVIARALPKLTGELVHLTAAQKSEMVQLILGLPMTASGIQQLLPELAKLNLEASLNLLAELPESTQKWAMTRIIREWTLRYPSDALTHAQSIDDSSLRVQSLKAVMEGLNQLVGAPADLQLVMPSTTELQQLEDRMYADPKVMERFGSNYTRMLSTQSPQEALRFLETVSESQREKWTGTLVAEWARTDLIAATSYVNSMQDPGMREQGMKKVFPLLARKEPELAWAWVSSLENDRAWRKIFDANAPADFQREQAQVDE